MDEGSFPQFFANSMLAIVLSTAAYAIYSLAAKPAPPVPILLRQNVVDADTRAKAIKDLLDQEDKMRPKKPKIKKSSSAAASSISRNSSVASIASLDQINFEINTSNIEDENIQDLLRLSSLSSSTKINKKFISDSPFVERKKPSNELDANRSSAQQETPELSALVDSPPKIFTEVIGTDKAKQIGDLDGVDAQKAKFLSDNSSHVHSKSNGPEYARSNEGNVVSNGVEKTISAVETFGNISRQKSITPTNTIDLCENVKHPDQNFKLEVQTLKVEHSQLEQSNLFLSQKFTQSQKTVKELQIQISRIELDLKESRKFETSTQFENSQLIGQVNEAKQYYATVNSENSRLKQMLAGLEESLGRERLTHEARLADAQKTIIVYKNQMATHINAGVEERTEINERNRSLNEEISKLLEEKKSLILERKKLVEDKVKFQNEVLNASVEHKSLLEKFTISEKSSKLNLEKALKELVVLKTEIASLNKKAAASAAVVPKSAHASLAPVVNNVSDVALFKTKIVGLEGQLAILKQQFSTLEGEKKDLSVKFVEQADTLEAASKISILAEKSIVELRNQITLLSSSKSTPIVAAAVSPKKTFEAENVKLKEELKVVEKERNTLKAQIEASFKAVSFSSARSSPVREKADSASSSRRSDLETIASQTKMIAFLGSKVEALTKLANQTTITSSSKSTGTSEDKEIIKILNLRITQLEKSVQTANSKTSARTTMTSSSSSSNENELILSEMRHSIGVVGEELHQTKLALLENSNRKLPKQSPPATAVVVENTTLALEKEIKQLKSQLAAQIQISSEQNVIFGALGQNLHSTKLALQSSSQKNSPVLTKKVLPTTTNAATTTTTGPPVGADIALITKEKVELLEKLEKAQKELGEFILVKQELAKSNEVNLALEEEKSKLKKLYMDLLTRKSSPTPPQNVDTTPVFSAPPTYQQASVKKGEDVSQTTGAAKKKKSKRID